MNKLYCAITYDFDTRNPTVHFNYVENGEYKRYLRVFINLKFAFNIRAITNELINIDDMHALMYVYCQIPCSEITS